MAKKKTQMLEKDEDWKPLPVGLEDKPKPLSKFQMVRLFLSELILVIALFLLVKHLVVTGVL